ncbi:UNVERIFIED_ORG: hypothetical protein E4P37_03735 [Bacillus sp. AZ43]
MTSGQGGPYGDPGRQEQPGPPPGWNPPPAQPDPRYPGYAPAPSAPTGFGAPPPMERPTTVRAGLGAFVAAIVLSAVAQVVTLLNHDLVVDWTLDNAGIERTQDVEAALAGAESSALIGSVVGFLFIGAYALFVWFAWQGRNWARIVLWVLGGLGIVSGLAGLAVGSPLAFLSTLNVFQLLIVVAGVVLLALKPSNDWFRYRGWQRANGRG